MTRHLTPQTALLIGAVLLSAAGVFNAGLMFMQSPTGPAAVHAVRTPTLTEPRPLESYEALAARPLFVKTRRPTVVQPVAVSNGPSLLSARYVLVGTMLSDARRLAVFRDARGETLTSVAQGGRLDAWTVTEILNEGVRVKGPGGAEFVPLEPS